MRTTRTRAILALLGVAVLCLQFVACGGGAEDATRDEGEPGQQLSASQIEDLVRRSWQYVAMYNVNNKGAMQYGGWNIVDVDTELKDHTLELIARPNNDSLYITCMLDLRKEPVILQMPAFDSKYVSLMVTGYDHYVNIPLSTRQGDFGEPETMLFFSERTKGYEKGQEIEGVDRYFEATGDFLSAVFRVMPHANEPERFERIKQQMQSVELLTLSELRGENPGPIDDIEFPAVGKSDVDLFENNLLEVMQFVFNHTTFDPDDELDAGLLAVLEPLGIAPGNAYDPDTAPEIDGDGLRAVAQRVAAGELAKFGDQDWLDENLAKLFQPKGQIPVEIQTFQSVAGPVGQPAEQALYPAIITEDGTPMNAMHDYEIVMTAEELPPVNAFWSTTLYENEAGFFIPNDRFKYSVGENAGFKLDEDGGIRIVISAEEPEGVPEENWLPINRADMDLDVIMRLYAPDLERYEGWAAPRAKKL